jgi:hypothetical protein
MAKLCPFADFTERAFGRELLAALEVAPPTALPVVGARGHIRRSHAHPVFANSRGEITAYDAHGKLQWQVRRCCILAWLSHHSLACRICFTDTHVQ